MQHPWIQKRCLHMTDLDTDRTDDVQRCLDALSALGLDARAAARGGLLHDLYLYNWLDKSTHPHCNHAFEHPLIALKHAKAHFPITEKEADIIATHMFPLPLTRPYGCLESFVVSTADKLCAVAELLRLVPHLTGPEETATPCLSTPSVVK